MIKILSVLTVGSTVFLSAAHSTHAQKVAQPLAKQVSVNGTIIRYWEQGRGVPVIFVHGAISDHRYWEPQREAVAKYYRFIALDRRFFGTAPWPDKGVKISQRRDAEDLAAFIRELKIGPAFLVGISGGANVALKTAVEQPVLVRGLFLHEAVGLRWLLTDSADRGEAQRAAAINAATKAGNMAEVARLWIDGANGPGSFKRLSPEEKAMFVENARTQTVIESAVGLSFTCQQLGKLTVPVTLTKGELSNPRAGVIAEAAHRCIPKSQVITIPNAHHGAPRENPSAFNEVLLAFLAATQAKVSSPAEEMQLLKKLKVNDIEFGVSRGRKWSPSFCARLRRRLAHMGTV